VNDLYAEWDTMETVNAVRDALSERFDVTMIEANEEAFEKLREKQAKETFRQYRDLKTAEPVVSPDQIESLESLRSKQPA
jgi:L-alanine-DL-glutamate epimerase-like enolase superfamily enzyme